MNPDYSGMSAGRPADPSGYPAVPPPPLPYAQQPPYGQQPPFAPQPPTASGSRRRVGSVALAVAGWLVIASGTAGAVVAVGSGGSSHPVAGAAGSPTAGHPKAGGTESATPSPTPTTASPTPTPSPSATVKGHVSGGSHSGDLRYFLLPVPDGDQVEGDPNGVTQSVGDVAKEMDNPSTSRRILGDLGCRGGAYRSFVTNDGVWTVTVHLIHFDGSGHASDWVSGLSFAHGTSFHVSGISDAIGRSFAPSSQNGGQGLVLGVSHVGDVEYEVDITGAGSPSRSLLTQLMQRQEQRLSTGV